jgi:tRNA dimethylallyltransferase
VNDRDHAPTRPLLIVVGGPTASGKTAAAVQLAQALGTEVISADSRQFYRAMRIGTARPTAAELGGVPHHFLGHLDLEETWSAGQFARAAEPVLHDILQRHGTAVLVGGSGLYIDALVKGLDALPAGDSKVRTRLQERFRSEGLAALVTELERRDPATYARIDRANPHRVIRALEICIITGRPYSEQRSTPQDRTDIRILRVAMDLDRATLYHRIDARVDRMIAEGLEDEVRSLTPYRHLNALLTVGYAEFFRHFDGTMDRATTIALIKQHSRNYAKRQLTWLRRGDPWHWVAPTDPVAMLKIVGDAQAR